MTNDQDGQNIETPEADFIEGFDEAYAGKRAECEGGAGIKDTKYAGRQYFVGTLTGHYREFGVYKWRWYLLGELTVKPETFHHDAVWAEGESLTLEGDKDFMA